jgi:hypothetical protein
VPASQYSQRIKRFLYEPTKPKKETSGRAATYGIGLEAIRGRSYTSARISRTIEPDRPIDSDRHISTDHFSLGLALYEPSSSSFFH